MGMWKSLLSISPPPPPPPSQAGTCIRCGADAVGNAQLYCNEHKPLYVQRFD